MKNWVITESTSGQFSLSGTNVRGEWNWWTICVNQFGRLYVGGSLLISGKMPSISFQNSTIANSWDILSIFPYEYLSNESLRNILSLTENNWVSFIVLHSSGYSWCLEYNVQDSLGEDFEYTMCLYFSFAFGLWCVPQRHSPRGGFWSLVYDSKT
jgi:hypothetical protein